MPQDRLNCDTSVVHFCSGFLVLKSRGAEISVDNVIGNFSNIAFVRMILFLGTFAKQSKPIHNSLDTLVIYLKPTVQKLMMYSPYAVSLLIFVKDTNNFGR